MTRVVNVDAPNIPKRTKVPAEYDIKTWLLSLLDRTMQGLKEKVESGALTNKQAGHHLDCIVAVTNHMYQFYADQRVLESLNNERNDLLEKVQGLEAQNEELEERLAIVRFNKLPVKQQEVNQ